MFYYGDTNIIYLSRVQCNDYYLQMIENIVNIYCAYVKQGMGLQILYIDKNYRTCTTKEII